MQIYPAIDLKDQKCVRLTKGDYNKMEVYNDNPVAQAQSFIKQGATFIHIVDLDGAKSGIQANLEVIANIKKQCNVKVQVGGGIRKIEDADNLINIGVDRIIIGTKAIEDEAFLIQLINKYQDKIAVGIDVKDGFVATNGWLVKSEVKALSFCTKIKELGVKTIIYTDISKDGMMQGIDSAFYAQLTNELNLNVIASGGVTNLADLINLNKLKVAGAIVGKALYLNKINLEEAILEVK